MRKILFLLMLLIFLYCLCMFGKSICRPQRHKVRKRIIPESIPESVPEKDDEDHDSIKIFPDFILYTA